MDLVEFVGDGRYIFEILEYGRNVFKGFTDTIVLYKGIEEDVVYLFCGHSMINCDRWKNRYYGSYDGLCIGNVCDGGW